jgi:hypothetical protein
VGAPALQSLGKGHLCVSHPGRSVYVIMEAVLALRLALG